MVFIVYDVWMCRYICEEPPLYGIALKEEALADKRGETLKIDSSNDTQEATCLLLRTGERELINDTIGVPWITKS